MTTIRTNLIFTSSVVLVAGAMRALSGCSDDETIIVVVEAGPDGASNNNGRPDAGGGGGCAETADVDTCSDCCRSENPEASLKYGQLVVSCFCQEGAFCKEQCKDTLCAADTRVGQPGDPCEVCISEKNETCGAAVNPGCFDDPGCAPILECLVNAGCPDKPQL